MICTYPVVLRPWRCLPVTAAVLLRGESMSIEMTSSSQSISYLVRDFLCMPEQVLGYAEIKFGLKADPLKYEVYLYPRTTGEKSICRT